jgi:serine protease Do
MGSNSPIQVMISMKFHLAHLRTIACLLVSLAAPQQGMADELINTIARVKASVVAIAILNKTSAPPVKFIGSGFTVNNGLTIITNAHVVEAATAEPGNTLGIVDSDSDATGFREAKIVSLDTRHDLAKLKIGGRPLPALKIGDSNTVREGQSLLFTGFPLGMLLGFHHVTHRAMVSAITPIAIPARNSHGLNAKLVKQLQGKPYDVFQLDGTAYPGNSGSPLYDPVTGNVLGIINKVFVQGTKEAALSQPSGITYAIPSRFILELVERERQ